MSDCCCFFQSGLGMVGMTGLLTNYKTMKKHGLIG